jgi:hypothetical protein
MQNMSDALARRPNEAALKRLRVAYAEVFGPTRYLPEGRVSKHLAEEVVDLHALLGSVNDVLHLAEVHRTDVVARLKDIAALPGTAGGTGPNDISNEVLTLLFVMIGAAEIRAGRLQRVNQRWRNVAVTWPVQGEVWRAYEAGWLKPKMLESGQVFPRQMAYFKGKLYQVVNGNVHVYDSTGRLGLLEPTPDALNIIANRVTCLAVGEVDGLVNCLVVLQNTRRYKLVVHDSVIRWGETVDVHQMPPVEDASQHVQMAIVGGVIYTTSGDGIVRTAAGAVLPTGGLEMPTGSVLHGAGDRLYLCNGRLLRAWKDGTVLYTTPLEWRQKMGTWEVGGSHMITVSSDNTVYVANNNRIRSVSADGVLRQYVNLEGATKHYTLGGIGTVTAIAATNTHLLITIGETLHLVDIRKMSSIKSLTERLKFNSGKCIGMLAVQTHLFFAAPSQLVVY